MDALIIATLAVIVVMLVVALAAGLARRSGPADRFALGPAPRRVCYADMACGPTSYCRAYFADDPTYGGRCAPA